MNHLSKIETLWQSYLSTLSEEEQKNAPPYGVDQFADTPEAATKVGKLVRDGVKTTTSSLVWGLEHIGEPLPKVGQIELIVDGNGDPLCIIELTEVEIKPFNAVDEQFAFEYGEGDRTLAGAVHAVHIQVLRHDHRHRVAAARVALVGYHQVSPGSIITLSSVHLTHYRVVELLDKPIYRYIM